MPDPDDLAAEWQALRARNYGEEGIPVIVGIETVGTAPPHPGEPELAAEFLALRASSDAGPAAIIELIALRELKRLG